MRTFEGLMWIGVVLNGVVLVHGSSYPVWITALSVVACGAAAVTTRINRKRVVK